MPERALSTARAECPVSGVIEARRFDAVLLDLDGVLTDTARLHAKAWKETFDRFLEERAKSCGERFAPFDSGDDYRRHVDGKPRLDGVRGFLASRGIELPEGVENDPEGAATIRGLARAKNARFRALIDQRGVPLRPAAEEFLAAARAAGLRIAVVTASRNGPAVVERAGLAGRLDTLVDGTVAAEQGLAGKPRPDSYLEAARRLGSPPSRAVVIEDALAGVEAGAAGGFGLVVGVGRENAAELAHAGADLVIEDLAHLRIEGATEADGPPLALACLAEIRDRLRGRKPAVFLDYDGTLTPIVDRPDLARLGKEMRASLSRLARLATVTIVSGRGLADLRSLVGLDALVYAGAHGFDISGPEGSGIRHRMGEAHGERLAEAAARLRDDLSEIDGVLVEEKGQAVAVHYRLVAPDRVPEVEAAIDAALAAAEGLRKTGGKMIFELRPDIDWDKGKAVLWLLDRLGLDRPEVVPIYLGDDLTDHDAFRALAGRGLSFLVADTPVDAPADYLLADTCEVRRLLDTLADWLEEDEP